MVWPFNPGLQRILSNKLFKTHTRTRTCTRNTAMPGNGVRSLLRTKMREAICGLLPPGERRPTGNSRCLPSTKAMSGLASSFHGPNSTVWSFCLLTFTAELNCIGSCTVSIASTVMVAAAPPPACLTMETFRHRCLRTSAPLCRRQPQALTGVVCVSVRVTFCLTSVVIM